MTDRAFQQRLRAIFAEEAREHLAQIDVALVALEQAGFDERASMVERVLKALHTLKGAARAVDEGALERLCHALEGALAAVRPAPALLAPEQFDRLHQAAAVARSLVEQPGPRSRNRAGALTGQLDSLATQLANDAAGLAALREPVAPLAAVDHEGAAAGVPDAGDEAAQGARLPSEDGTGDWIRVHGRSIDVIRAHTEALLPVELKLRHHAEALRELAAAMTAARHERADAGIEGFDLACARLAEEIARTGEQLYAGRTRLADAVLETALVPFAAAVEELPALARKLARGHGKQVQLDLRGSGIGIDRRALGVIREALIHLVTNAVDHAIEPTATRQAAGKSAAGHIEVMAVQRDARLVAVRVSDDGAGIDADALAEAAVRQLGLAPAVVARMSEQERLQLALRAGVSTRTEVTPVSGRGVGLAVVSDKVAAAGGQVLIETRRGAGTTFELVLPVGVTSMRVLVIEAAGARYALPLGALAAVTSAASAAIRTVEGRETILADGRVLPLVRLAPLFGKQETQDAGHVVLVARVGAQAFGILVDAIIAEQDVLPKRLGPLLRRVRYISAAAQLGDGTLVPVVSLKDIATYGLAGRPAAAAPEAAAAARRLLVVEDSVTSRLLLKHILEGAGCSVDTAVDGLDALSRLRGARYDAVVSDVEMPNMDGLALTASIRANPQTAELPVILVTSLQTAGQRAAGLRAGADAYFTKGAFDQDRLLATVRRVAGMEGA
jgi:two-component system chemotaxis sensor kinase CheA